LAEALPALMERDVQVLWQSGRPDYETVSAAAEAYSDRVAVRVFIDEMAAAYSAADLAVTRAGGMTLAELSRYGVPAVLVPLPTAAENHQEYNARSLVRAGAARMVRQADLDGKVLATLVSTLMDDPESLAAMAKASRSLAAPDAADRIVTAMVRAGLLRN
jgi:UDP-N-acetylglucosamine--N-acetylmuramyl-(pentapeptide) pyrophosphoryl-undecaprenol N-acetylglucosamine transferase